jgi:hypothetical protein
VTRGSRKAICGHQSKTPLFKEKVTWDNVHYLLEDCAGVDDMIVENTGFEGQAFLIVANSMTPKSFFEHLRLELSNDAAKQIMKVYDMKLDMDQNAFLTRAMRWIGDVIFDGMLSPKYYDSYKNRHFVISPYTRFQQTRRDKP